MLNKSYYVYIIRCQDNSLYTGITTDVKRRFKEHKNKLKTGAKYTKNHDVKEIVTVFLCTNRILASRLEYYLKKLKKYEKEELISDNNNMEKLLGNKISVKEYQSRTLDFRKDNNGRDNY